VNASYVSEQHNNDLVGPTGRLRWRLRSLSPSTLPFFYFGEGRKEGKEDGIYMVPLSSLRMHTHKALRHGSHSFTCKQHHACISFVSVHQMTPPQLRQQTSNCRLLLIYRPRRDERLSWSVWLTNSGWFNYTRVSGHPSATVERRTRKIHRRSSVVLRDHSRGDQRLCVEKSAGH